MEIRDLIKADQKLEDLNNKDLYHLCQEYGRGIKALRRIFSVLLVEVFRRSLHRKYGFESIHEFGARVGGMNRELVDRILWLVKALEDKPYLRRTLRTEGWSKVRVVANIATKETDQIWAEKVCNLSKPALQELVKNLKEQEMERKENLTNVQTNVFDNVPKKEGENTYLALLKPETSLVQNLGNVVTDRGILEEVQIEKRKLEESGNPALDLWKTKMFKIRFNISGETEFRFHLFKQRLQKKNKMTVTAGETLAEALKIVERAIVQDKEWRRYL